MPEQEHFPTPEEQPVSQSLPEEMLEASELETPEIAEMIQRMEQVFSDRTIAPATSQRMRQRLAQEWQILHSQQPSPSFWKRWLNRSNDWQPGGQARQAFAVRLMALALFLAVGVLIAFPNSSITPGAAGVQGMTIGLVVIVGTLLGLFILWIFRKH